MLRVLQALWLLVILKLCQSIPDLYKGPDGGYSNLIVSIHRDVSENRDLIEKIKDLFTLASPALHKATFGAAYFKEVTIVVPNTWGPDGSYENAVEDLHPKAHFRVESPNSKHGDEPYTLQHKGCGEPGLYTHWTPNYLLGNFVSKWASRKKERREMRLIQEWGHLRYGLFDEFGYPGDKQNPSVYYQNKQLVTTICHTDVPGTVDIFNEKCEIDNQEGLLDGDVTNCEFVPRTDPVDHPAASIMFTASVPGVDYFCDDTPERKHNTAARSKHNDLCHFRSTWAVISDHPDFKNSQARRLMAHYSREKRDAEKTRFRVVRTPGAADGRIVFVLDTSGSMKGRPMELLHVAASRAILDHVPDGSRVGIVAFSTLARTLAPLTVVTQTSRDSLAARLPKSDDQGYTAIGKGLLQGLDVLGSQTEGARIILVTDGEENVGPTINDVIGRLTLSGAQVMPVAFGTKATDKLERLAQKTGGKVYFFPDLNGKKPSAALDSAFLESTTVLVSEEQQPIRIVDERLRLDEEWKERPLVVEDGLGKNLLITVTAPKIGPIQLTLTDPNGISIGPGNSHFDKDEGFLQRIRLEVPTAVKGVWKLSLRTMSGPSEVHLSVQTQPKDFQPTQRQPKPVRIRAWIDDIQPNFPSEVRILAQVVKGGQDPVSGATVTAIVTRPNSKSVDITLKDNGKGADVTEGDGIYSGFFTQYTGNGRYAVFVRMINYEDAKKNELVLRTRHGRSTAQKVRIERVADAGAFRLNNWVPRDEIPPSRVTDLIATSQRGRIDRFWVTWTAPGDDMDFGRASKVDIRVSMDPDSLRRNFTSCMQALEWLAHNLTLAHGGEAQRIELIVPENLSDSDHELTFYLALQARDKANNVGEISNFASVTLSKDEPSSQAFESEERKILVPLVAGACAILVLIALSGLILMIYTRRKDHKTKTHYFGRIDDVKEKELL